jgi:hypothetical protein
MMKSLLGILSLSILFITFSFAEIINVPSDIDSIQGGIDMANEGDTVLVQPGVYVENINFNGKNIVVGSLTLTTNDKQYISQTVIDGDSSDSVVKFGGQDSSAVLCGFTITNGNGLAICGATCEYHGGGITCLTSNPTLSNLLITGNISEKGGGIFLENSSPKLIDVTITENKALYGGGGIHFGVGGFPLWNVPSNSSPEFSDISRCNIYSNYSLDSLGNDLAYRAYSDTVRIRVVVDTFTVLNPDSSHANPLNSFILDIKNSIVTDILKENKIIPNYFTLKQNFPNPFNPSTTIEFTLPKSEFVELKVYNILGKEVSTVVSNKLNQGNHTYSFDGKNLASGIYYYQLTAGDYREVKKMILLR